MGTDESFPASYTWFTGTACRGSEQKMANGTLQSLFREPRDRRTDRAVFAQAVSRISDLRSGSGIANPGPTVTVQTITVQSVTGTSIKGDARKPAEDRRKVA